MSVEAVVLSMLRPVLVEMSTRVPERLMRLMDELALRFGYLLVKADSSLRNCELPFSLLQESLIFVGGHVAKLLLAFLEDIGVLWADGGVAELEFPLLDEFLFFLLWGESELFHSFLLDLPEMAATFSDSCLVVPVPRVPPNRSYLSFSRSASDVFSTSSITIVCDLSSSDCRIIFWAGSVICCSLSSGVVATASGLEVGSAFG